MFINMLIIKIEKAEVSLVYLNVISNNLKSFPSYLSMLRSNVSECFV